MSIKRQVTSVYELIRMNRVIAARGIVDWSIDEQLPHIC